MFFFLLINRPVAMGFKSIGMHVDKVSVGLPTTEVARTVRAKRAQASNAAAPR